MSAPEKQLVGTAFFKVSGQVITDRARHLWQSSQFVKALELLDCLIGATDEHKAQIISGTSKLVGFNDLDLVPDDWDPPAEYLSYRGALTCGESWEELQTFRETEADRNLKRAAFLQCRWTDGNDSLEIKHLVTKAQRLIGEEATNRRLEQFVNGHLEEYPEDNRNVTEESFRQPSIPLDIFAQASFRMREGMLALGLDPSTAPSPDAIRNRGMNIVPKLCRDMSSRSGWLLLDGRYYGCETMEHIGLAEQLLKSQCRNPADAEKVAEDLGWIKIAWGITGLRVCGKKVPTTNQINKLWDYARFHNQDYDALVISLPHDA